MSLTNAPEEEATAGEKKQGATLHASIGRENCNLMCPVDVTLGVCELASVFFPLFFLADGPCCCWWCRLSRVYVAPLAPSRQLLLLLWKLYIEWHCICVCGSHLCVVAPSSTLKRDIHGHRINGCVSCLSCHRLFPLSPVLLSLSLPFYFESRKQVMRHEMLFSFRSFIKCTACHSLTIFSISRAGVVSVPLTCLLLERKVKVTRWFTSNLLSQEGRNRIQKSTDTWIHIFFTEHPLALFLVSYVFKFFVLLFFLHWFPRLSSVYFVESAFAFPLLAAWAFLFSQNSRSFFSWVDSTTARMRHSFPSSAFRTKKRRKNT